MRIAALIVGLVIGFAVAFQACSAYGLSALAQSLGDEGSAELTSASAAGVLTGLLILVGAGFVLPFPRVASVFFVLAGILGISVASSSDFSDQALWGVIAFGLAGMAVFGARNKQREDLAAKVAPIASDLGDTGLTAERGPCPRCGESIPLAAMVCRFCGLDLPEYDRHEQPAAGGPG